MKKIITISIALVCFISALVNRANAQGFEWAHGIVGPGSQGVGPLLIDDNNNVYSVGVFNNTVDFDQSSNIVQLTSVVNYNMFLMKQDEDGNFQWVKQFAGSPFNPTTAFLFPSAITSDADGNIYIAGTFTDTFDFDPGPCKLLYGV